MVVLTAIKRTRAVAAASLVDEAYFGEQQACAVPHVLVTVTPKTDVALAWAWHTHVQCMTDMRGHSYPSSSGQL